MPVLERSAPLQKTDLILLQQILNAAAEGLGDLSFDGLDLSHVYGNAACMNPEITGVLHRVEDFRRLHQSFCRNTADIETGAAAPALFRDYDIQPVLCGVDRRLISARPCADHQKVCIDSLYFAHENLFSQNLRISSLTAG